MNDLGAPPKQKNSLPILYFFALVAGLLRASASSSHGFATLRRACGGSPFASLSQHFGS